MATIKRVVATGRRMNGRDGLIGACPYCRRAWRDSATADLVWAPDLHFATVDLADSLRPVDRAPEPCSRPATSPARPPPRCLPVANLSRYPRNSLTTAQS